MLSSLLTAATAMQSFALRPEQTSSTTMARLAESLQTNGGMAFLKGASGVVDNILLQTGNATEHLSDEDQQLLESVIVLIREEMYGSMDTRHAVDDLELKAAIAHILECNQDIVALQSATGDLGKIHQEAISLQSELNTLRGVVNERTDDNNTIWGEFDLHMQTISDAPACPDFPSPRGMATLDVYFEKSLYSAWWTAARTPYHEHRKRWEDADKALRKAINSYNLHLAVRDVKYCDWKAELEAACARFEACYASRSDYYSNKLVPRVESDMMDRFEIFKAGQTLLAQINFLLAHSDTRETPDYETTRFELDFPEVPAKALCDLTPLDSADWSPPVDCGVPDAMQGRWHDPEGGFYEGSVIVIEAHGWHWVEWKHGEQTFSMSKHSSGWDLTATDSNGLEHHHIATLASDGKIRVTKWGHYKWTLVRVPQYYAAKVGGDCASTCANVGRRCNEDSLKKVNSDVDSYDEVKHIAADLGLECKIPVGGYGNNPDTPQYKTDGKCLFANNGGDKSYSCTATPGGKNHNALRLCYCEV